MAGNMYVSEKEPMMVISGKVISQQIHLPLLFFLVVISPSGTLTITKDLRRWPGDAGRVGVHAVADELASSADIVDGILKHLGATASLNNYSQHVSAHTLSGEATCYYVPISKPYGLSFLSCSHCGVELDRERGT